MLNARFCLIKWIIKASKSWGLGALNDQEWASASPGGEGGGRFLSIGSREHMGVYLRGKTRHGHKNKRKQKKLLILKAVFEAICCSFQGYNMLQFFVQ